MDLFSVLPQSTHIRGQYLKDNIIQVSERRFICPWDKNSKFVVNGNLQKFYFNIVF